MAEEMDYSEACRKLIAIFQAGDDYLESYELMLMTFCNALGDGDTPRMALALAKDSIKD